MNIKIQIFNSTFKAEIIKNIDKAGKYINRKRNKKSKNKLKLYFLNIEKKNSIKYFSQQKKTYFLD